MRPASRPTAHRGWRLLGVIIASALMIVGPLAGPSMAQDVEGTEWPREILISGEPADMHTEISQNYEWFQTVSIPKLFLYAKPGMKFDADDAAEFQERITHLDAVCIGKGKHYIQEDQPDAIGQAISSWIRVHAKT